MHYKSATALAALLLAASSASVFARPAIATDNANLRSGPGVEEAVIAVIPGEAPIDVGHCAGSWCRVSWNGVEGYLSRPLIGSGPAPGLRGPEEGLQGGPDNGPDADAYNTGYADSGPYDGNDDGYDYADVGYPDIFFGSDWGRYAGARRDRGDRGGRPGHDDRAVNSGGGGRDPNAAPLVSRASTQGLQAGTQHSGNGGRVGGGAMAHGHVGGGHVGIR